MVFWLILLVVITVISFYLALKSTKNSSEKVRLHQGNKTQALFLIRQPQLLSLDSLKQLHHDLTQEQSTVSFERLFKGEQQVLTVYGPNDLPSKFPDLALLELEDYLIPKEQTQEVKNSKKINADQAFIWIVPVKKGVKNLSLEELNLASDEQLFYQVILKPWTKKEETGFSVTTRAMAATFRKDEKVKLAKRLFNLINKTLDIESDRLITSPQEFEHYQFRLSDSDKREFQFEDVLELLV